MKKFSASKSVLTLTVLLATIASPACAATLVTNRAALGGNDQINWSSLGKVFNPLAPNPTVFLSNSFSAVSPKGEQVNVQIPATQTSGITPPLVFVTTAPPQGIPTNFANGDYVLLTGLNPGVNPSPGNPGPITITFNTPVKAAGTQVAVDDTLNFTAFVSAYDKAGNLLGSFQAPGNSSVALNNSAIFLGVSSDTPNIAQLVYSSSISNRALGINTLSIATVPEPRSIYGFIAFGVLSLVVVKHVGFRSSTQPTTSKAPARPSAE